MKNLILSKKKLLIIFLLIVGFFLFYKNSVLSKEEVSSLNQSDFQSKEEQNFSAIFRDLLKIFFSVPTTTTSDTEIKNTEITPTANNLLNKSNIVPTEMITPAISNSLPVVPDRNFSSLREIFNEVGAQIGVPPVILEAVLQVEMPSVFRFTPEQIRQYSLPGNTIPNCRPNVCSATGPMQMTIGRDGDNNPLCPNCCWKDSCLDTKGGCPNAWAAYGQGNPCNLKDNIRAAARKLKRDSRSTSPIEWSKEEVYRASYRYYGNCTVKYPKLGDRTYCEYVWWYYQTVQ